MGFFSTLGRFFGKSPVDVSEAIELTEQIDETSQDAQKVPSGERKPERQRVHLISRLKASGGQI